MTAATMTPLYREPGCRGDCLFHPGFCDRHQVPPVCICRRPDPDGWGQCNNEGCKRPYRPGNGRHMAMRAAWRDWLGLPALEAVR